MVITRSDIMLATDFLYLSYTAVPLSHWRHQPWGTRSAHPLEFVYMQFLHGVSKMSQVTRHQPWGTRSRPPPGVYTCAISRRCLKNVQSYALSPRRHCFRNHLYCRCAINSIHLHLGLQRFQLQCSIVYYDSVTCCYYTQSGQFSSLLCRHFCDICLISGSKSWPRHCTVFYLCLFYVCCFNLNK